VAVSAHLVSSGMVPSVYQLPAALATTVASATLLVILCVSCATYGGSLGLTGR
jgi:hypothetical protein